MARVSTWFKPGEDGEPPEMSFFIEGLPGFFLLLALLPVVAGVVLVLITPILKRMMHGVK